MNVNVFVLGVDGAVRNELLVLPLSPQAAIPPEYRVSEKQTLETLTPFF